MSPPVPASQLPPAAPLDVEPMRVRDVPGALGRVHPFGEFVSAHAPDALMDRELYTTVQENNDGSNNHFQGFQRLHDGRHFVISGGNWRPEPRGAEIYVGRIGSIPAGGPWLSNLTDRGRIPDTDAIVGAITVDPRLWHAGGMDVCGPILAVAVEHNGGAGSILLGAGRGARADESAVHFFDMTDPTAPRFYAAPDQRIHRAGHKAGAVALTRLTSGHYLCAAWSDSEDGNPWRLDVYVSTRSDRFDGVFDQAAGPAWQWHPDNDDPTQRAIKFQAINFVRDLDGQLYLLGLGVDGKTHAIEAYRLHTPGAHAGAAGPAGFALERLSGPRKTLHCQTSQCDLRGASGVYLEDGLTVYSAAQYRGRRTGDPVRFAEFRGPLAEVAGVTAETAWVELYAQPGHGGARLTLRDLAATGTIANYKDVRVAGRHFGDKARSARYQLPAGLDYVLYEHHDFRNPIIRLRGTGKVDVEPDFHALGEKVSSSGLEATP